MVDKELLAMDSQLLRKVAKEMNDVMGLEPPLSTNIGKEGHKALYKGIAEESVEINLEKDAGKFSKDVQAFLEKEGLWPGSVKSNKTITKEKGEKEMAKTKTKKTVGKKKKATESKKVIKKVVSKKKSTTKKSEKKVEKKVSYTRSNALVDALKKKGATKEEMIDTANNLYVKHGGKDNKTVSKALLGYVLPSLILLGVVKTKDDKYSLV